MKYCSKCGAELEDDAIVCPRCGCETELGKFRRINSYSSNSSSAPQICGILSIVFGLLGGWLGLVLGIVCIATDKERRYRHLGIIGIVLFLLWIVILICVYGSALASISSRY